MGIDSMRVGGGRCPPLLVGGLLIICLMLICNWWTLSSENLELVRQIDELNEQLKISMEEKDQCIALRNKLEQRYKQTEDQVAHLHVRLEQQNDLKKKHEEVEESYTMCKGELDSLKKLDASKTATLETLRLEKETINTHLREEIKKLQNESDMVKDELEKVKLTCNAPSSSKPDNILSPTRTDNNKIQLRPVPESAVRISVAGQRGMKYHEIPILPPDLPGAVRLAPRLSITMLKAAKNFKTNDDAMKEDTNESNFKQISKGTVVKDVSNQGQKPFLNIVSPEIDQKEQQIR